MLSQSTIDIVKSTAPLIAEAGPSLTAHFYERMFKHHPELKDVFNITHQETGSQREALFNAVYGYASNIDNIEVLLPVVEKIAQKHTSFNITADQYQIVGTHLLATIDELMNPGQAVLDAWAEAYGLLANIFINREEEIYQQKEQEIGGWRGTREFKVIEKTQESNVITSFVLTPVDGQPIIGYRPGQYIGVYLNSDKLEFQEIRQYSLSDAPNGNTYRISVKREDKGIASNYLHTHVNLGDSVQLAAPAGDFFITTESNTPIAFISAGVGLTPMLSMLESIKETHQAPIHWLHATDNSERHGFKARLNELTDSITHLNQYSWYKDGEADFNGLMDLSQIQNELNWQETDFYLCGPVVFMQYVAKQLVTLKVPEENIHYECFGPHKVL
ncbi:NO-inducible flavohemoprotein [Vibrio casei]|uniref:Flavohemoprotein n=1 Tax=Vibrio casei TaxID=673372 RepID=A0A368LFM2_9VIBR|nr:NO-inducible flavohemoprotein [Vibrio casei]RCS68389.1 NO-inducible flavohemoprotein [Vibrio casei]SJN40077.1 Flavohemoprotein (Hemoglobin-like protein) (Flavohemoglobin) (Nitric oxide dioxygenase) [Vibrio casei]